MAPAGRVHPGVAVAMALLATLPALPSPAAAAGAGLPPGLTIQELPWWNATASGVGKGLHLRVLVQVNNTLPFAVTDGAVAAELDLARLLSEAGWPSSIAPGQVQLKAFQLDPNSLRVVPLNDLDGPATVRGTPKTADPGIPPPDPRRYEEPSAHFEGSLTGSLAVPFDARTNPHVTVVWRVSGTLAPLETRHYMVYFDTVANLPGPQPEPSYGRPGPGSALQALFWSSPGPTLYGTVPASAKVGTVTVAGLHPRTNVSVWSSPTTGPTAGLFQRVKQPPGFPQPAPGAPEGTFQVGADSSVQAFIAASEERLFRLEADRPILGFGTSTGFVPSTSGNAIGTEFLFALTQPAMWEQDTIYFIDPAGTPQRTDATTVEVQALQGGAPAGAPRLFSIGSNGNPWPYTRGARAGGFTSDSGSSRCEPVPPGPGYSPLLPLGPGLYRARVQSGGRPVMLQLQPTGGLVQAPSTSGAPTGTSFQAVTGWTDLAYNNNIFRCVDAGRPGSFVASAVGGESAIAVTSWEEPNQFQIFPPGAQGAPSPGPRPLPQAPEVSDAHRASSVLDRPVQFTATGAPVRLFVGQSPPVVDVVQSGNLGPGHGVPSFGTGTVVNGPLWGSGVGRQFAGLGATQVVAPFPDTRVAATLRYSDGTTATSQSELAAGGTVRLSDAGAGRTLAGFLLEASKPVFAYPVAAPPGTLAGVPAFLSATPLGADFRGHLVRIATEDGQDPAARSTPAGAPVTYRLLVTNLGRGINNAGLADDIVVSLAGLGQGWEASLDSPIGSPQHSRTLTQMASGETRPVLLTVKGDASLQQGAASALLVQARSQGNPKVADRVEVATSIKSSHAVGLWFDFVGNVLLDNRQSTPAGVPYDYHLVAKNLGSVPDTVQLATSPPLPQWAVELRMADGGAPLPADGLPLLPGDPPVHLVLHVTPPATKAKDALAQQRITVTASSVGNPAAFANRFATTRLTDPTDVRLHAPVTSLYVAPGATASFPVDVRNSAGATELAFRLESDAPASWPAPVLYARDFPVAGTNGPVAPSDLFGANALHLEATLEVPRGEPAHLLAVLHLVAAQPNGVSLERFLHVIVAAQHALEVPAPGPAAAPAGGGNLTLEVVLGNRGNLNESLRPRVADLPPQWRVALPPWVAVARNGNARFPVNVTVPAAAPPGLYNVTLLLVSEDGNATRVGLQVQVGAVGKAAAEGGLQALAQPGGLARAAFPVRNQGNTPLVVAVSAASGEPWGLAEAPPPFLLGPGAATTVRVAWAVPRGEPEGNSTHRARLVLTPRDAGAAPSQEALAARFLVGRSDLELAAVRSFAGAAGTLVSAAVANRGHRAASGVVVQLRAGGMAVDNVTLAELPAGATANATLLLPRGTGGAVEVALDPQDAVVELDEGNNVAAVAVAGAAPAAVPPMAALLAVLAALAARRRRHG